jgi:hypothetical protein
MRRAVLITVAAAAAKLVTLHLWLWYPNPAGLYHGTNPWIRPFNHS